MADETVKNDWIDEVELEDVQIKWAWSHFDGRDSFSDDLDYSFTIVLPEKTALELREAGWTSVKENEPYEEGDPPEWTMKIKISFEKTPPKIYLIKRERKFRVEPERRHPDDRGARVIRDLHDIRRDTCDQIDVIITPSRWVQGPRTGITAYVKEMYAKVRESRFAERYSDMEEV